VNVMAHSDPECARAYERSRLAQKRINNRACYWRNRECSLKRARAWRKANPEVHRACVRRWAERNLEKLRTNQRAWRERNLEKHLAQQRASYQRRKQKVLAQQRIYKAQERVIKASRGYNNAYRRRHRNKLLLMWREMTALLHVAYVRKLLVNMKIGSPSDEMIQAKIAILRVKRHIKERKHETANHQVR